MDPQDTSVALMLTLILSLLKFGSGQWQVIAPDKTVQVLVGEDAIFSCSLSPKMSAEAMEVCFFRDQFSSVIHLYRDGEDQNNMQIPEYRGRTQLLKDSIVDGRVSLRLKNATLSDTGLYGCWFRSWNYEQKTSWEMQVSALGSTPLISIMRYFQGGIQLQCKSSGWFPQPIVKWKSAHEDHLPSDTKLNADKYGLFDVESFFSIQENSGSILCSIQLTDKGQKLESRIWIGDIFFQSLSWRLASISLAVLCLILCMAVIGLIMFYLIFKGQIWAELNQRRKHGKAELEEAKTHAVQVTLDTDMTHSQLSALKSVVPSSKKRFDNMCMVASQVFHTGKHYWEVEVGHNERWYLGVCQDGVYRNAENVTLSPNNGYWVLGMEREHQYFTLYPHRICLSLGLPPTRVGVLLDYKGGTISFYNTNDQSLICTLTHNFKGLLRPFILHEKFDEENMTPIVFYSVSPGSEKKSLL